MDASATDPDSLVTVNLATGISTFVSNFGLDNGLANVDSIAISPEGDAYAVAAESLYTLDLVSGQLSRIGAGSGIQPTLTALAFKASDSLWGVSGSGELYSIDLTTGVASDIQSLGFGNPFLTPRSIQFDSKGVMWLAVHDDANSELWSYDSTATPADPTFSGNISINGGFFLTYSLLIAAPAPPPAPPASVTPEFTSANAVTTSVGAAGFRFFVTATGAESYGVVGVLPGGLKLNATTGEISGTPTTGGRYTFTLTATNGDATAEQTFTLTVGAHIVHPSVAG